MMVTFVSQCEKKALIRTRRVLDTFANRIGDNTWQTIITEDGLITVKKLLRQSATKNTAVSCHWLRSRSRSELVWIVGDRSQFNEEGMVPVNRTGKNINNKWENNWHYLPLIKAMTSLAALLHDWGKASVCFQEKLKKDTSKPDPLRHEWISTLLFSAFVGESNDEEWINRLIEGKIVEKELVKNLKQDRPFKNLSKSAKLIGWLIVTHHKLPHSSKNDNQFKGYEGNNIFDIIDKSWQFCNQSEVKEEECFQFAHGLLLQSEQWLNEVKESAQKLLDSLYLFKEAEENNCLRIILLFSRLSLMLGDYNYSSQGADTKWQSSVELYANTSKDKNSKDKKLKQKLDEHLVGVKKQSSNITRFLPYFESRLENDNDFRADIKYLKSADQKYLWQDKAENKIEEWKTTLSQVEQEKFGFFAINIASTGCGKTIANAKIMNALSHQKGSLRYVLALGLRTLTLQTGDEYRTKIGLDESELAVLIGSQAIMDLHNQNNNHQQVKSEDYQGSESLESLLEEGQEIRYQGNENNDLLSTVLRQKKDKQFLYAPVLCCTIDHLISAVNCKKGGRYILPFLRLMSSDLVIDEIDDFSGDDLIVIGWLIHLAGMLGRKVMISSATIPPKMAEGYFNAYREGFEIYCKSRKIKTKIGCALIDEFKTAVESASGVEEYKIMHQKFINYRVEKLLQQPIKRPFQIISCKDIIENKSDEKSKEKQYFELIARTAINLHKSHFQIDTESQQNISFGVIRTANINPCVELSRYFMEEAILPDDVDIKVMTYHSAQVLLLRSEQEKFLNEVLKRNNNSRSAINHSRTQEHIKQNNKKHLIFILVATPVEEVGRDHDFDWAVIEPSSFRSIIQLAGRVLRHRDLVPKSANIAVMEYNLKGLIKKEKICYAKPGYEAGKNDENFSFKNHSLNQLIKAEIVEYGINSIPRIQSNKELKPREYFDDLEHYSIANSLTNYEAKGPESLSGWIKDLWWLTAEPQKYCKFRSSMPDQKLYLIPKDSGGFEFKEKRYDGEFEKNDDNITHYKIPESALSRLWYKRNYRNLLAEQVKYKEEVGIKDLEKIAQKYGEINVQYEDGKYWYNDQLGLFRVK